MKDQDEQKNYRKTIAIIVSVSVVVAVILAFVLRGCLDENDSAKTDPITDDVTVFVQTDAPVTKPVQTDALTSVFESAESATATEQLTTEPETTELPVTKPPVTEPPQTEPVQTKPVETEPPVTLSPDEELDLIFEFNLLPDDTYEISKVKENTVDTLEIPTEYRGKKVTVIGKDSCRNLNNITEITVPEGIKELGLSAFANNSNLKKVTLPESLLEINNYTFYECRKLEGIHIPSKVTYVGYDVFQMCVSLEYITMDEGNEKYFVYKNTLCRSDRKEVIAGCKNSEIPSDPRIDSIHNRAFVGASGLKSIVIPKNIINIYPQAFGDCKGLESVTFEDPEGWTYTEDGKDEKGQIVDLSDPKRNAEWLCETYRDWYWEVKGK